MSKPNKANTAVYFGTTGLSSTAAEHLSHVASDMVTAARSRLASLSFVTRKVSLVDSMVQTVVAQGSAYEDLRKVITEDLVCVVRANAFIAWVREAIKTKKAMIAAIDATDLDEWVKVHHPEYGMDYATERERVNSRMYEDKRTADDYLDELDVREMCEYLGLEARAAAIGKLIHPSGQNLRSALTEVLEAETYPNTTTGSGRDMTVAARTATVDSETLQHEMAKLQGEYREVESRLNKIRYENKRKADEYNRKLVDQCQAELRRLTEERDLFRLEKENWASVEREKAANLKIVIPDDLKGFVEELNERIRR